MPINSTHKEYESYLTKWQRARDASAGQDAVHAAGIKYLPKLSDQEEADYINYKMRATYFNATCRTIDGLVGMIMRKPPEVDGNGLDELINDVDLSNNSLASFAQTILREVITVDRVGVLVEYPSIKEGDQAISLADQQARNERPYATIYKTENIINWEEARVNNKVQPVFIMLKEVAEEENDEYTKKDIEQYRELRLVNGIYIQKIWRENKDKGGFEQVGNDIVPLLKAKPLTFIPFYSFGSDNNSLSICNAPILDLANLNLAHYRVNADYEHGCHFTGLPMLFLKGITLGENETVSIGSQKAVVTNSTDADGKYIEFTGQGLTALENNLERKEKQMAAIGARFLEQQKNGVESEGAMQMRSNGENSVLAGIANLVSDQLSNMLQLMAEWNGTTTEVLIKLNTDYMPVGMTAQELTALVAAYQGGTISFATFFENLVRGEIITGDRTEEEEKELIDNAIPNLIGDAVAA